MSLSRLLTPLRGIVLFLALILTLPALALILAAPAAAQTMTTDDMVRRGVDYATGRGVAQSDSEAVRWYRAAAEGGNAVGMHNLGVRYLYGRGVAQSDSEAVRWFRAAAAGGDAAGMLNLGYHYWRGEGVAQSDAEAARWWRAAYDAGLFGRETDDGEHWTVLGEFYYYGRGVAQNNAEAAIWFRRGAERSWPQGMWWLGYIHDRGHGVPRDPWTAATHLLLSEVAGVRWFRDSLERYNRDTLIEVQSLLRDAGHYTGALDGSFGPASLAALRAYEGG